jgi:hypothetical protein
MKGRRSHLGGEREGERERCATVASVSPQIEEEPSMSPTPTIGIAARYDNLTGRSLDPHTGRLSTKTLYKVNTLKVHLGP